MHGVSHNHYDCDHQTVYHMQTSGIMCKLEAYIIIHHNGIHYSVYVSSIYSSHTISTPFEVTATV
jgi:hypothetical protein